jgi:hypothetical protein
LDGIRLSQEEVELVNNYISMIFDIVRVKRFREEEDNKE